MLLLTCPFQELKSAAFENDTGVLRPLPEHNNKFLVGVSTIRPWAVVFSSSQGCRYLLAPPRRVLLQALMVPLGETRDGIWVGFCVVMKFKLVQPNYLVCNNKGTMVINRGFGHSLEGVGTVLRKCS